MRLRLVIADDHPLFRVGLRYALEARGFDIVAEAKTGQEALIAAQEHSPDFILMDIKMPELDGIEACRQVRGLEPAPLVIMLTTFEEPAIIQAAQEAGASGYVDKETSANELSRLIHKIHADPDKNWMPRVYVPSLTRRERQVLELLAEGCSNKAIAKDLGLSPETVKDYLNNLYRKLDVNDRMSALIRAQEFGLIT